MRTRGLTLILVVAIVVSAAGYTTLSPSATQSESAQGGAQLQFANVSAEAGLSYAAYGPNAYSTAGVYAADVNNDRWTDLLTLGSSSVALFVNEEGEFRRQASFPAVKGTFQGAFFFDYDGDGWRDLLLLRRHAPPVVLENQQGSFARRDPASVGLDVKLVVPSGASAEDYDRDGDLDLFITQSGSWQNQTPAGYHEYSSVPEGEGNGAPNLLFENTGDGFERVDDAGISGEHWSLTSSFVDLNADGYPDIHVANDYENDTLYLNQGNGTFQRVVLGATTDRNAMASEVFDVNRDGRPDLFVTNIDLPVPESEKGKNAKNMMRGGSLGVFEWRLGGNNLLINRGNGTFVDRAGQYGVQTGGWGWAAVAADFDDDGDRDLVHTTSISEPINESRMDYSYPKVWERRGDGFERLTASEVGLEDTNGRGVAALDYDRDGDVDIVIGTLNNNFVLYENRAGGGNSIGVLVEGTKGVGARVTVTDGNFTRTGFANLKTDYQSQDTRVVHFGLGERDAVDRVRITFDDGRTRVVENVTAGTLLVVGPNGIERVDRAELRTG